MPAALAQAAGAAQHGENHVQEKAAALQPLRRASLAFVPNRGQHPTREQFTAQGQGYLVSLEKARAVVTLPCNQTSPAVEEKQAGTTGVCASISMDLLGANAGARIASGELLQQKNSFLPSGDPKTWISNVPSYGRVNYSDIYGGIDLAFYGREGRLEYDFTLAPGADARAIGVGLNGADQVHIDPRGDLVLEVKGRELRFLKPVAYQLSQDGKQKQSVDVTYELARNRGAGDLAESISFALGDYDHSRTLVIDPVLAYGEVLPSTIDYVGAMTADSAGNTYIAGNNPGTGFYIEKLDTNGNVLFDVSLGTSGSNFYPQGIALDSSDDVFVTGYGGAGLPTTTSAYQQTPSGTSTNPFLSVLKSDGSGLAYSTYFGGSSNNDEALAVAVDSQGKAYIAGQGYSSDFPTTAGAYKTAPTANSYFGFVAKIDPTLSGSASAVYSALLVNPNEQVFGPYGIAVDSSGNAYVASQSYTAFPVTSGAFAYAGDYQTSLGAYITKLNSTGSALVYSAYLGPGQPNAIAVDGSGSAYVTGAPGADDFPTTTGAYQTSYAGGFATKLSADGSTLAYSTFLSGPSGYNSSLSSFAGTSIVLTPGCSSACTAYITGYTNETDLPVVNPIQNFGNTNYAAFLVELAGTGNSATYATYLGGLNASLYSGYRNGYQFGVTPAVAVDGGGNAYLALNLNGTDVPATLPIPASAGYGYLAKISPAAASLALALPNSVAFGTQPVNVSSTQYPGTTQPVELRNLGSSPITLQTPFTFSSSQFSETDNCVSPLGAGALCTLNLFFTPSSSGTQNGTLTISSNAPNTPTTVSLTGTGIDYAYIEVTPTSLSFSDQVVDTASASQTVTITNIGDQPATFGAGNIYANTADYTVVNNCPAQLAAGQSCRAGITFTPTQIGQRSGALYVNGGSYVGTLTVAIGGTGIAAAASTGTLTPGATSLNFGSQLISTTSGTQYLYLYNNGSVPITVNSAVASTTGQTGTSDFQLATNSCGGAGNLPAQILPASDCFLYVTFTPSTSASETGTLTITSSASTTPITIALSGVGIAATQTLEVSPANFVFPDQPVGIPSASQTFYIYNTGTDPFVVDRVLITGDFADQATGCVEQTLNPSNPSNNYTGGYYCVITVTFTPTATGSRTGTLSLIDAATGNPQVFNLMGNGIAPTGSLVPEPASLTFEAQPMGTTSADQMITLENPGNSPVQINSLTTSGNFAVDSANTYCPSTGSTLPGTAGAGSYCYVYVNFTPTQTSGAVTGTLVVGATSGTLTIPLNGTAEAATQAVGLTPTTFNFGTVQKGTTVGYGGASIGDNYGVFVRNTGTEAVTFSSAPTITGTNAADFSVGSNYTCGSEFTSTTVSLAPGTSCSFILSFTPSTTTAETATLTLTDSAGAQTITLSGTGATTQPAVSIYPPTLAFDLQPVGTTSSLSYYVYLVNNGTSALTVQSAAITAGSSDFVIPSGYNNCSGDSVGASGGSCYVYVNFAPSTSGYRTGTLTFTAGGNTYTVALSGYAPAGVDSATLDPQALQFLPQPVNAISGNGAQTYQTITLTNTGNRTLTVGTLTGTDVIVGTTTSGDFTTTANALGVTAQDNCSNQPVQPGSSCNVYVAFIPTTTGSKSGSITFPVTYFDNTTGSFTVTLSGQATADKDSATLSSSTVSFPDQVAAYPNPTGNAGEFPLTLTNTGSLAFTVNTLTGTDTVVGTSTTGDFVATSTTLYGVSIPASDGCSGQTVAAKSSCSVYLYFAPGTTGAKSGSITFPVTYTDGTKGSFTATLTGNSIAAVNTVTITPTNGQFESQIVGTTDPSNSQTLTVQNTGNIPVTIGTDTLSSTNFAFDGDNCTGGTIRPSLSCPVSVQFTPQAAATPGTLTGTLTITDSATGNPHKVSLSGPAIAATQQFVLSQSTVSFGSQAVTTTSNPQVVYVTNQGSASTLSIKSVLLGGTNPTDFTESDSCGGSVGYNLPSRSNCTVTVAFSPAASSTGARTATVAVTPTTGTALVITLNGTGINPIPQATVFPASINFGSQPVNTTSTTSQAFSITNTGSGTTTLNIKSVVSSDPSEFTVASDGCTGQSLAPNSSCNVSLTFTPSVSGARGSSIVVTDNSGNVANTTQSVAVSGTGTGTPQASLNKTLLTFPNQTVNTVSTAMPVTLTNGGTAALAISSIQISGGSFAQTNTCGTSLAASGTCTISVTFDPQSTGALSASLVVTDNANGVTGTTQSVTLNGTGVGVPQASLSTSSEVFGSTPVGTPVTNPVITLTNGGTGPLTISSITVTGTNAGDFTEVNTCAGSVAASGTCTITVTFTPSGTGSRTATITVTDNANGVTGATQTVSLSGTGLGVPQASLNTSTLSYGSQNLLSTSTPQVVTLTNGGTGPLTISSIALGGTNPGDFSDTTTCTASLSSTSGSNTCTISVSFSPQAAGSRSATLVVTDNANGTAGSTQTVNLGGTGTINSQTITFGALPNVTYGVAPITLTATASSGLAVNYTVTGPATISGSTLTITGAGTVKVTANQAGNADYAAATAVSQSFTVSPAVLTVTANNALRAYGAANPAFSYTITGFVGADTISLVSGTATETTTATSTSAPGTYPITFSTEPLTAANYTFTYVSGTLTVTTGTQTITFAALPNVTYGVAPITLTATASSGLAISYTAAGPATVSGSTLTITGAGSVTVTASQAGNADYSAATSVQRSFAVAKAALTITANNTSITYGQAIPSFTYTPSGFVDGDTAAVLSGTPSESTTATIGSASGTYPITITQGTLAATNYTLSFVNGTLTISGGAAQTITFGALPNVTYGVAPITLTATASSGLAVSYTATGPATVSGSTLTITGAGTVKVTANQAGNSNYAAATAVSQSFTVSPAVLTVTANNASRTYGAANPTFTYAITGFVNSDNTSVVSGTATETTTATNTSVPGTYPITFSSEPLTAANYTFTYVSGTLTVTTSTQTITFGTLPNVTYGVAPITLTATASSGLAVSYTVTGPATVSGSTLTITGAGTVKVTANQAGNSDYAAATAVSQSFTVSPAVLTVTANNASRLFGAANPAFTYTITGFVGNDTISVVSGTATETTTATSTSPVGTYPITFSTEPLTATNYTFTYVSGTLTVTGGATQTITFGTLPNVTYGVAPITLTATASSGLAVSYTVTGPATVSGSTLTITGAGTVKVTANQAGNSNYAAATAVSQSFTVSPVLLTVTANNASRLHGAANPAFAYTVTGFVNSDTILVVSGTATETTTATTTSAVGTYPITFSTEGLTAANYVFNYVNGVLTVLDKSETTIASLTTATATIDVFGFGFTAPSGSLTFTDTTTGNPVVAPITLNTSAASTALTPQVTTSTGTNTLPDWTVLGDINGDGKLDLITSLYDTNSVSVQLGNGDGTFQPATNILISSGFGPAESHLVSLRGNGVLDLIVGSFNINQIAVLLGNGNGTFQSPVFYTIGSSNNWTSSFTTGDFNGDGLLDVAVANTGDNTISVLLGNGSGALTLQTPSISVGNDPEAIRAGDFNADGYSDLAVANYEDGTVTTLLNNRNGTFTATVHSVGSGVHSGPQALAINGSGTSLHLAVANYNDNTVSVMTSNGNGTFGTQTIISVGKGPDDVNFADFNGDGLEDLVVANYTDGTVDLLLANTGGSYTAVGPFKVGNNPYSAAVGDIDLDGTPDVVVSNCFSNNVGALLDATMIAVPYTGLSETAGHSLQAAYAPNGASSYESSSSSSVTVP